MTVLAVVVVVVVVTAFASQFLRILILEPAGNNSCKKSVWVQMPTAKRVISTL